MLVHNPKNSFRKKPDHKMDSVSAEPMDKLELELEQRHIENSLKLTAHIMEQCGKHITNLTVSSLVSYRTQEEFVYLLDASLRLCPNVKKLIIVGGVPVSSIFGQEQVATKRLWPHNQFLVKLAIEDFSKEHDAIPTTTSLVTQLSLQLRELRVPRWNAAYSHHKWQDLRKLDVKNVNSVKCLKSLESLNAPSLKSLKLCLSGVDEGLKSLMELLSHFPNLEDLELGFGWDFIISEDEVVSQYPTEMPSLPKSIKRLTIKTGLFDNITYSLLAYFPFLEYLYISYGWNERLDSGINIKNTSWRDVKIDKENPEEDLHAATEQRRKRELVDLREYLYKNRKHIWKSNIWKILPFLRKITIGKCFNYYKMKPQNFKKES